VYFIHHAASLIQAQAIIAKIGRELECALHPLYASQIGISATDGAEQQMPADFALRAVAVPAPRSDYVEAIDGEGLMALAETADLVVELEHRPGDFAVTGEVIARAYPAERVTPEVRAQIAKAFVFGPERTQTQDPEFVLNELVEIATRALSPGINDPATAVLCVDQLAAALAAVASQPMPSSHRYGRDARLRVVAKHYGFAGLVDAAFNPIRQYGASSVGVTIRLLEGLRRIALRAQREEDRDVLMRHASMIDRASKQAGFDPHDREDVLERFGAVLEALGRPAPTAKRNAA
jgi:uncharacterized membrane protein